MLLPLSKHENCRSCAKPLRGRIDKKFCDDRCRNLYNNQIRTPGSNLVRNINHILNKNRRILQKLFNENKRRVRKETLLQLGFEFKYLTHIIRSVRGKLYFYCYDFGYVMASGEKVKIIRDEIFRKSTPVQNL